MSVKLAEKIRELEDSIIKLKEQIVNMQENRDEDKPIKPYTVVGGGRDRSHSRPVDIKTGLGNTYGGNMAWNNSSLNLPAYGKKPESGPTIGYNKHFHSRFAGGPLEVTALELVLYDNNWTTDTERNIDNQEFWLTDPTIKKDDNGNEQISTIMGLNNDNTDKPNMVWDKDSKCWRFYAVYARDID